MFNINLKFLVLSVLLILFFSYSLVVYTSGTEEGKTIAVKNSAADGKLVFQKYNCISCHQLYGLGGYMGPDLTNVISAPGKGELYAKAMMASGTAKMPDFNLSEKELEALLDFLKYVDKTGRSPHFDLTATLWGNITEKAKPTDSLITLKIHDATE